MPPADQGAAPGLPPPQGSEPSSSPLIRGRVVLGLGEGAAFTSLPWVREQVRDKLGFDPYPGTLNLELYEPRAKAAFAALKSQPPIEIVPLEAGYCRGLSWPVTVQGQISGAIIVPEIAGYPDDKVEIVAPVCLRDALALREGDLVNIEANLRANSGL